MKTKPLLACVAAVLAASATIVASSDGSASAASQPADVSDVVAAVSALG